MYSNQTAHTLWSQTPVIGYTSRPKYILSEHMDFSGVSGQGIPGLKKPKCLHSPGLI